MTMRAILKEMKDFPDDRLEELYQFIHSLNTGDTPSAGTRKKILSFGGAFGNMNDKEYADFIRQTKKTRAALFNRNIGK